MSKPLILVTGAAGKTGTPVVEQLIERGFQSVNKVNLEESKS